MSAQSARRLLGTIDGRGGDGPLVGGWTDFCLGPIVRMSDDWLWNLWVRPTGTAYAVESLDFCGLRVTVSGDALHSQGLWPDC